MKTKIAIAGLLLTSRVAMAEVSPIPDICKSVANYAAQALALNFTDGKWTDPHNPKSIRLKRDFKTFPISAVKFIGNCDEDANLKSSWCQVAGGSPDVFQMDIGRVQEGDKTAYPFATVIVTFNRGGCWVDETSQL